MHITDLGSGALLIRNCIISYPHLFKARRAGAAGQQTGDPKFSANLVLPADLDAEDQSILNRVYQEAIARVWPSGAPGNLKSPWHDGKEASPQLAGRLLIKPNAKEDSPPGVFSQHGRMGPAEASQIFAGCIVNAHVRCYAYKVGSNGVTFGLNDIQLVDNQNVTRLDNRKSGADVFGIPGEGFPQPTTPVPDQPAPTVPPQQQHVPGAPAPGGPMPGVQQVTPGNAQVDGAAPTVPSFLRQ